ncbi:IS66 family transposase [Thiocystis minor]|uniref:IS66 family transposase n=1 Tax=Thiocystis minor TaxID=61597 RepID=UPI003B82FEA8
MTVELWNDWDAIFRVLENPQWPLTNNDAERALRHWAIARRIMMGTLSEAGSRAFTLLASVIDTCRKRGYVPWWPA